jgi:hypothetical protein
LDSGLWNVSFEKDIFNQINYNDLISRLNSLKSIGQLEQLSWVALNINENLNNDYQESEKSF